MSYIEEFKKKDLSRFDEFYESSKKSVFYAIYLIVKSVETTEDLMQETYISFLENVSRFKKDSEMVPWLVLTAKNKALNYYNRMKYEGEFANMLETYSYSKDKYIDTGLISKVKDTLTEKEFEIFVMHVLGEYSFKEISELLDIPTGTLTWMYQESRKKLIDVFGGN